MKKRCIVILFAWLLYAPLDVPLVCAQIHQDSIQITTKKHVLNNGLTVLISEMPSGSMVSVYALVKTGSATEGKFLGTGVSHFLEHMIFKGTAKRDVGVISREVQALGGTINASTSFDYTVYTITVPPQGFAQVLDIISDALMHSRFDAQEIEKEREVVYGEMRLRKDRPASYLSRLVFNTVYIRHPYRVPIIGHESLLRELKREDFFEYYRTYYIPNNMILSVAGKVNAQEALSKIREAFKDFARGRTVSRNLPQEPRQISARRYEEEYPTELTRMSLSYAGVSILDKDMFALDVLAMIIGQGESSRLYLDLFREKKLVHAVSASNFTPMDQGIFEIECVLEGESVAKTVETVKDHIKAIVASGVKSSELEKAKRQVLSQYIHSHQTSGSVAYSAAVDEAFAGDYDFSKKYVVGIKDVTNADIKQAARTHLVDNNLSIVILRPHGERDVTPENTEKKTASDIKKIVLANGLTVLLRENHSFPLVAINLVMNAGTRQEPSALNGLSQLTSGLWTQGTQSRTAEEIAQSVESLGASLNGFSGRNSFGITLNVLSQDMAFGIDLIEDLIKNPSFDGQEFLKEKEKMETAIVARNDSIYQTTAKALRETLFQTHPFRLETLGTLESVKKITQADVAGFYGRLAVPKNMVLSLFGDFHALQAEKILTDRLSRLKSQEIILRTHSESPPDATREKTIYSDKKQAMVMIGFQGVDVHHKDRTGLEVLSSILGSSFNGRIFTRIRDESGKAYTLGGGFLPGKDMGLISFYVITTDEYAGQVKEILLDLLNEIREDDITDQELRDIKSYLKGEFHREIETDASLGFVSTLDELYGMGYDYYQDYNNRIDQVTREDIKHLAQTYLNIKSAAIIVSRPKEKQ